MPSIPLMRAITQRTLLGAEGFMCVCLWEERTGMKKVLIAVFVRIPDSYLHCP